MVIDSFTCEYRFLSNFWPATVEHEGIVYPSVEHAYQAAKTHDTAERRRIAALKSAGQAKRAGRGLRIRSDWESVKVGVMTELVRQKFTNDAELRERLLATVDFELVEGNSWNDQFWGVCRGVGKNWLGRILMLVRAELLEATVEATEEVTAGSA